jgi:hypothetical protein
MRLCCDDLALFVSEFDEILKSLERYISQGELVTVNDIVDYIRNGCGNALPDDCDWLLVNLSLAMLRLVKLPELSTTL